MQRVRLIDESRNTLATAQVVDEGEYYGGTIDLTSTPAGPRALFEEFEEVVNGQMFSLLDEIQAKISVLRIQAVFESGYRADVRDLQAFPTAGDVSFKVAELPAQGMKLTEQGAAADRRPSR
jgi:hypothetical protein